MARPGSGFSITAEQWRDGEPAEAVKGVGEYASEPDQFARLLLGVIAGMRAQESVWGNGESFGGSDLCEAAARLLVLAFERESRPGEFWDPADAERDGFADRLARLRAVVDAARAFVEDRQ